MRKIFKMGLKKDLKSFNGFYIEDIHKNNIPKSYINIAEDLWSYLLELGDFKFIGDYKTKKDLYTVQEKDEFEKIIPDSYSENNIALEDRISAIEQAILAILLK
ncbi:hypothetical protein QEW_0666 [Clostridioides difficile CD160]|nr:hypothetical protein QEW_0666 [Clostridioides difficile CD160]